MFFFKKKDPPPTLESEIKKIVRYINENRKNYKQMEELRCNLKRKILKNQLLVYEKNPCQ